LSGEKGNLRLEAVMVTTKDWPTCQICEYRSLDEDEFVLGEDGVFRCNVCDEDQGDDDEQRE
jgi:hypothetical protein